MRVSLDAINAALAANAGNVSAAARELGIARTTCTSGSPPAGSARPTRRRSGRRRPRLARRRPSERRVLRSVYMRREHIAALEGATFDLAFKHRRHFSFSTVLERFMIRPSRTGCGARWEAIMPTERVSADEIRATIERWGGNISAAARQLGVQPKNLRKRLDLIGWRRNPPEAEASAPRVPFAIRPRRGPRFADAGDGAAAPRGRARSRRPLPCRSQRERSLEALVADTLAQWLARKLEARQAPAGPGDRRA